MVSSEIFFERYGSHVHYGLIELGGVLISKAYSKGFEESLRSKITEMTTAASKTSATLGFRHIAVSAQQGLTFKASDLKYKESLDYSEDDLKQITVILKKIGGPIDINDKDEWTRQLEKDNTLWRIISRSSIPKPIWELLEKHKDAFDSYLLLAHAMEEDWKKVTKMKVSTSQRRIEDLQKDIILWLELHKKEENMIECMKALADIRSKHRIMDEDWRDVLYSNDVQELLLKATKTIEKKQDNLSIQQLVTYVRSILHPLNKIDTRMFTKARRIVTRMNEAERAIDPDFFEVKDLTELGKILKEKITTTTWKRDENQPKLRKIQQKLEEILKNWPKSHPKSYEYLICLGVCRLFGFNLAEFQFDYYLSQQDFNDMSSKLGQYLSNLAKCPDKMRKQAYTLNLAMGSSIQKAFGIKYFKENMPDDLCESLDKAYSKAIKDDNLDAQKLQSVVLKCLDEQYSEVDLKALLQSLKSQLHFTKPQKSTAEKDVVLQHGNLDRAVEKVLDSLQLTQYFPQKRLTLT